MNAELQRAVAYCDDRQDDDAADAVLSKVEHLVLCRGLLALAILECEDGKSVTEIKDTLELALFKITDFSVRKDNPQPTLT